MKPECHPDLEHYSDGLCKSCWRARYYAENKERIAEQQKAYRQSEKGTAATRAYYKKTKVKQRWKDYENTPEGEQRRLRAQQRRQERRRLESAQKKAAGPESRAEEENPPIQRPRSLKWGYGYLFRNPVANKVMTHWRAIPLKQFDGKPSGMAVIVDGVRVIARRQVAYKDLKDGVYKPIYESLAT